MNGRRWLRLGMALMGVLMAAWAPSAVRAAPSEEKVIVGESFVLPAGKVLAEDLVVLGGSVTVEQGAVVDGAIAVFGGSVVIAGEVTQDVTVVGGSVELRHGAVVDGDVVVTGGKVQRAPTAQVRGRVIQKPSRPWRWSRWGVGLFGWTPWMAAVPHGGLGWALGGLLHLLVAGLRAGVLAALAALAVVLAPQPTRRVAQGMLTHPWESLAMGLLGLLITPVVVVVLVITLVGIPLALVGLVVLALAALYGWLALGVALGQRLAQAVDLHLPEALEAALGALVLYLVVAGAHLIPCVGWVIGWVSGLLGLGGVVWTLLAREAEKPSASEASEA